MASPQRIDRLAYSCLAQMVQVLDFACLVFMHAPSSCCSCPSRTTTFHTLLACAQNLPAELYQDYCTVEYQVPRTRPIHPPAYMFVVDTSLAEDELLACKAALTQALQTLPEYAYVGLVTYGTHVHVHELGFQDFAKAYVFQVRCLWNLLSFALISEAC